MTDKKTKISEFMLRMAEKISGTAHSLHEEEAASFLTAILSAKRIYVAGAGRSGFVAKAFGMRLMHLGFDSYVVGETITPALSPNDTLVAFSGSGETNSVVDICETAKDLGAKICLVTASPESRLSRIADCVVNLGDTTPHYKKAPTGFEMRQITGQYRSVMSAFAPLGTLFETAALIFSDAVVSGLIEAQHSDMDEIRTRLTNLE
jgi:6-phospho-3-hexuloisomerase